MKKITPEKWEVSKGCEPFTIYAESENPKASDGIRQIAEVKQGAFEIPDYDEAEANARLIAAAPDLLEAAQKALALIKVTWIEDHGQKTVGETWGALEAAINKATGKPITELNPCAEIRGTRNHLAK